ncbi:hypothetical protein TWF281_004779 [Arthrobotrys megalospora]
MRGTATPLNDYVYWFVLEAFRWLDNGSIDEVELVYEEGGPTDEPPDVWAELTRWALQDWRDNPGSFSTFGWHGLEYIRKWKKMKWRFDRVPSRTLDRRGRFLRYWDYDEGVNVVVEEVVVWSVKRDLRQFEINRIGRYPLPDEITGLLNRMTILR